MKYNHSAFIKLIANAHPDRVRLLFDRYGINAPVSEINLLDAIVLYKKPFARDLATILSVERKANFDETEDTTASTTEASTTTTNQSKLEQTIALLNALIGTAETAAGAYVGIKSNLSGQSVDNASQAAQAQYDLALQQLDYQNENAKSQQKYVLIGGIVLVVVILAILFLKK